jgi:GT2 family glycosyltransferase
MLSEWPDVAVLEMAENVGFAAAVNLGVEASEGEYVAVLNNDVRVEPAFLGALVDALGADPSLGSAASRMLDAQRPEMLDGAGDVVGWDGYAARRGRGRAAGEDFAEPARVLSACAGAALYRRAAWEDVGPFADGFFAYMEDVDWGVRAQLRGWNCVYEPRAIAYHLGGATSGRIDGFELYHCHRNMLVMMVRSFPALPLLLHLPLAVARRGASLVRAIRSGHGRTILRAWGAGLARVPSALHARAEIQRRRVRSWRELRSLIPPAAPPTRRM